MDEPESEVSQLRASVQTLDRRIDMQTGEIRQLEARIDSLLAGARQ